MSLLHYQDGEKRYILTAQNVKVGTTLMSGPDAEIQIGNSLPLENIPLGLEVHNVELIPGNGGQIVRAAGTSAKILAKEGKYVTLRLPSKEIRLLRKECFATIGEISYNDAFLVAFQKGKRITLKEAGFEVNDSFKENLEVSSKASENPIDPEMVRFRVQVGAFKEKVPDDILASFKKLGTVMAKTNAGQGYTKYFMGDFMEYKNVLKFRSKLFDSGLIDCFIVGEFQNKIINSREALNLLGQ